jgi:hypothetical protein
MRILSSGHHHRVVVKRVPPRPYRKSTFWSLPRRFCLWMDGSGNSLRLGRDRRAGRQHVFEV